MNDDPEALYEAAVAALFRMFEDTSKSVEDARANLNALRDEIDTLLESIEGES